MYEAVKKTWRSFPWPLRVWLALVCTTFFVLNFLPLTNTHWWFAPEQRLLKERVEGGRAVAYLAFGMTYAGIMVWQMRKNQKAGGE